MSHVLHTGRKHAGFWWGNLNDTGIDWRIILKWIFKERVWEDMNWICLAEGRDKWRAVMNTVVNFRVPRNVGNFVIG